MEVTMKEVHYSEYCYRCKHAPKADFEDPCDECLEHPSNENSHKPVNFEEAK